MMMVAVLLIAFLATLAIDWPALPLGMRLPDVLFVPLAIAVALERRSARPRIHWLDALVAGYLAGALPSLLATTDMRGSVTELIRGLYLALIYVVVATEVARGRARLAGTSLAAGVVALSAIGLVAAVLNAIWPLHAPLLGETMTVPYAGRVFRLRALTASPAMLACALTVGMALALSAAVGDRRTLHTAAWRRWSLAAVTIGSAAALVTFSHAVVGLLAAVVVVVWPALNSRRVLRAFALTAVVSAVVIANVTLVAAIRSVESGRFRVANADVFHHSVGSGSVELGSARIGYEVMGYFRVKEIALEAFGSKPWTGIGLDRFHELTGAAFEQGRLPSMYRAIDPHSSLLGRLAETGLPGGITLVALWAGFLAVGGRLTRQAGEHQWIARAATAALVALLVTAINVDIMNFRFLWAGLGLLRGLAHEANG